MSSTTLFYGYVGLLIVAGAWGVVFGRVDQRLLLGLDLGDLPAHVQANVMSQYRFLRAVELGFGLWALTARNRIYTERPSNALFLFTMSAGVLGRLIGVVVDGSPDLPMYAFALLETAGAAAVFAYTRRTLAGGPR